MPVARTLSTDTRQEYVINNEALRSFLAKKGDEHLFSLLYLIGGIACLVGAFGYGKDFCTGGMPSIQESGSVSMAFLKQASVERHIALDGTHTAPGGTGGDGDSSAWVRLQAALKFPAVLAQRGPLPLVRTRETGKEALEAAATDLLGGNATRAEDDLAHPPTHAFLGPYGLVVLWLKVEGAMAVGLPVLSLLMLALRVNEVWSVSCGLYMLAVFQACWLVLGCVWSFGGAVPAACREGAMGDSTAYGVMWWVCGVWASTMGLVTALITVLVCCLAGASALRPQPPPAGRGQYAKVAGARSPASGKSPGRAPGPASAV